MSLFTEKSIDSLGKLAAIESELGKFKDMTPEQRFASPLVFPCDAITLLFGFMFNRNVNRKVRLKVATVFHFG